MIKPFHLPTKKIIGHEYPPMDEPGITEQMISEMKSQLMKLYPKGETLRQAHPKMHGCVSATFTVEPNLRDNLQIGVFKPAASYQCLIRFSNASSKIQPDAKKDIRGMAIKLLDVPGEKLLTDERDSTEQDFLLISHNIFVARDLGQFHETIKAVTSGKLLKYFINPLHWGVLIRTLLSFKKCKQVLEIPYWSTTPYQFGDTTRAVKYLAKPAAGQAFIDVDTTTDNYLRANLVNALAWQDAYFDFFVQFQTDAKKMPVENPTVVWKSEFIKLATIKIPRQVFDTPDKNTEGENLTYTPWHSLPVHRPLGGINRGRRHAYEEMAAFRKNRNLTHQQIVAAPLSLIPKKIDMPNATNEQIVQQLYAAYGKDDLPGIVKLLDPDVVWLEPGAPDVPFAGSFTGVAEVEKMLGMEVQLLKVTSFVPKSFFSKDAMVLVTGSDSANVIATGKAYTTDWVMEFTLANSIIIRVQTFTDTNAIANAFKGY